MNKSLAKKYLSQINSVKKKYVNADTLSRHNGIYPDVINSDLSYFEPMLAMDPSFNLKDLIPAIEKYIAEIDALKEKKVKTVTISKKDYEKYKSVADFAYKNMTVGGLIDRNKVLDESELKILRKLVKEELDSLKKK